MRWPMTGLVLTLAFPVALLATMGTIMDTALAGGPAHGARAAGMGTAFAAIADDPSAITHNPAGLAFQDGMALYGGAMVIAPSTTYRDSLGHTE